MIGSSARIQLFFYLVLFCLGICSDASRAVSLPGRQLEGTQFTPKIVLSMKETLLIVVLPFDGFSLYDTDSQELIWTQAIDLKGNAILSASSSYADQYLALGLKSGEMIVFDIESQQQKQTIHVFRKPVSILKSFHHSTDLVAVSNTGEIQIVDVSSAEVKLRARKALRSQVETVAISRDDQTIAYFEDGWSPKIQYLDSKLEETGNHVEADSVTDMQFTYDSLKLIYFSSDVMMHDPASKAKPVRLMTKEDIRGDESPVQEFENQMKCDISIGDKYQQVFCYFPHLGVRVANLDTFSSKTFASVQGNIKSLVAGYRGASVFASTPATHVFQITADAAEMEVWQISDSRDRVEQVKFNSSGTKVLASNGHSVAIWDVESKKISTKHDILLNGKYFLQLSLSETTLLMATFKEIRMIDIETGSTIYKKNTNFAAPADMADPDLFSMDAWLEDGFIVLSAETKEIKVFEFDSGNEIMSVDLADGIDKPAEVSVIPGSSIFAATSQEHIFLIDRERGKIEQSADMQVEGSWSLLDSSHVISPNRLGNFQTSSVKPLPDECGDSILSINKLQKTVLCKSSSGREIWVYQPDSFVTYKAGTWREITSKVISGDISPRSNLIALGTDYGPVVIMKPNSAQAIQLSFPGPTTDDNSELKPPHHEPKATPTTTDDDDEMITWVAVGVGVLGVVLVSLMTGYWFWWRPRNKYTSEETRSLRKDTVEMT